MDQSLRLMTDFRYVVKIFILFFSHIYGDDKNNECQGRTTRDQSSRISYFC